MIEKNKAHIFAYLSLGLSAFLYTTVLYHSPRESFYLLSLQYLLLFGAYAYWFQLQKSISRIQYIRLTIFAAILFRLIALFALPELSDDYFRFVWDGKILSSGNNPFLDLPATLIEKPEAAAWGLSPELYSQLNSPQYFTIYPPVNQLVFWLGASLSPSSIYGAVFIMKLCLFLAECGSLWLLFKLLQSFQLKLTNLALYALNPMVIIELCGNLHFEALMIFFLLLTVWIWMKMGWWQASFPFALAICSKLLPLMFLPLLIRRMGWVRSIAFGALTAMVCLVLFFPFLDTQTFLHLADSTELYFQKFEFNASVYYIVRWIGFQVKGYNIIGTAGKILPLITFMSILVYTAFESRPGKRNFPAAMMWCLGIYLLFASIVHPWYVSTMIACCVFTSYRFPILWSCLIFSSYAAYQTESYTENLWLIGISYALVIGFLGIELLGNQNRLYRRLGFRWN